MVVVRIVGFGRGRGVVRLAAEPVAHEAVGVQSVDGDVGRVLSWAIEEGICLEDLFGVHLGALQAIWQAISVQTWDAIYSGVW